MTPTKPKVQAIDQAHGPVQTDAIKVQLAFSNTQRLTLWQWASGIYHWCLWLLLTILVFAQFLGIFWNSMTTHQHVLYGYSPLEGVKPIDGKNDEPYSDRSLVCVLKGRLYKPEPLHLALDDPKTQTVDTTGSAINGYRVVTRPASEQMTLDKTVEEYYTKRCDAVASTMDAILDACEALGYDVTRDDLRIVDGLNSKTMKRLPHALPILLMPYWDNAVHARYAVPGHDGQACVFRLFGKYDSQEDTRALLHTVSRSVREQKTMEWLHKYNGTWRNGWYEEQDDASSRWFSDMLSTDPNNPYGIHHRLFDLVQEEEMNCNELPDNCAQPPAIEYWGPKLQSIGYVEWFHSVAISNGKHFGLFTYENHSRHVVLTSYDLETFLSNFSLGMLFFRWMVCMLALQNGYRLGLTSEWFNTSIGCLSCSHSFHLLPIILLPRLKTTLAAFFALGCSFEGQEQAFADAWFVIYPAIGEIMLFYYSLLNLLAKVLKRRLSDVLFGPTIVFFCLLHRFRMELGQSQWFEFDGRIATVMSANEFDALKLQDFVWTDAAFKLNGEITSLFVIKLVVLGLQLLPLLWSTSTSVNSLKSQSIPPLETEKALAVRVSLVGGFGLSPMYDANGHMNAYELVRLGFVVFGGKYVVKVDDWYLFVLFCGLRVRKQPPSYRIVLLTIQRQKDTQVIEENARLVRLNDARFQSIKPMQIASCAFR